VWTPFDVPATKSLPTHQIAYNGNVVCLTPFVLTRSERDGAQTPIRCSRRCGGRFRIRAKSGYKVRERRKCCSGQQISRRGWSFSRHPTHSSVATRAECPEMVATMPGQRLSVFDLIVDPLRCPQREPFWALPTFSSARFAIIFYTYPELGPFQPGGSGNPIIGSKKLPRDACNSGRTSPAAPRGRAADAVPGRRRCRRRLTAPLAHAELAASPPAPRGRAVPLHQAIGDRPRRCACTRSRTPPAVPRGRAGDAAPGPRQSTSPAHAELVPGHRHRHAAGLGTLLKLSRFRGVVGDLGDYGTVVISSIAASNAIGER